MTMGRISFVAACLVSIGWNVKALAQPPASNVAAQKSPDQKFDELLTQAQKDPTKTDWKALRKAFAATNHYRPYNTEWPKELATVRKELDRGEAKSAEVMLVKLLEREGFMRLDGHMVAIAMYEKLGDSAKARMHRAFLEGISSAVFVPGAGRSFEKPIEVLFVDEE